MFVSLLGNSNTTELMHDLVQPVLVKELREYIANIDIPMALENVALQYDVNAILDRLLQILEMEKDHVSVKSLVLVFGL